MVEVAVFLLGGLTALFVFALVIRPVMLWIEKMLQAGGESADDAVTREPEGD